MAFFDDDEKKWGAQLHGVPVLGAPELILKRNEALGLEQIIIAMPTAPAKRIGEIVKLLQPSRLKVAIVPAMDQLATGQLKVSQIRPVEIQDLLGRKPVEIETKNIREILVNRRVMVTGAGGSIGSELCRQIATFEPERLLLVEQSEVQLFAIEQELISLGFGGVIVPLIADIIDEPQMRAILQEHEPDVLFHAAAHKHVPMMERQPGEAIKNNFIGTARLAELALAHGVGKFVLISTDKAVNPTSAMGATKRLAEIYLQALSAKHPARNPVHGRPVWERAGIVGQRGAHLHPANRRRRAGDGDASRHGPVFHDHSGGGGAGAAMLRARAGRGDFCP